MYQLTRVVLDKIQRAAKWLCVCECVCVSSSSNFLCMLPVAMALSSFDSFVMHHVLPVSWWRHIFILGLWDQWARIKHDIIFLSSPGGGTSWTSDSYKCLVKLSECGTGGEVLYLWLACCGYGMWWWNMFDCLLMVGAVEWPDVHRSTSQASPRWTIRRTDWRVPRRHCTPVLWCISYGPVTVCLSVCLSVCHKRMCLDTIIHWSVTNVHYFIPSWGYPSTVSAIGRCLCLLQASIVSKRLNRGVETFFDL